MLEHFSRGIGQQNNPLSKNSPFRKCIGNNLFKFLGDQSTLELLGWHLIPFWSFWTHSNIRRKGFFYLNGSNWEEICSNGSVKNCSKCEVFDFKKKNTDAILLFENFASLKTSCAVIMRIFYLRWREILPWDLRPVQIEEILKCSQNLHLFQIESENSYSILPQTIDLTFQIEEFIISSTWNEIQHFTVTKTQSYKQQGQYGSILPLSGNVSETSSSPSPRPKPLQRYFYTLVTISKQ